MQKLELYVTNENHDILERYIGNSVREIFLKVCEKHFVLYGLAKKHILDENKIINDENLEKLLEMYFNEIGLNCIISVPFKPKKIVVYYDER